MQSNKIILFKLVLLSCAFLFTQTQSFTQKSIINNFVDQLKPNQNLSDSIQLNILKTLAYRHHNLDSCEYYAELLIQHSEKNNDNLNFIRGHYYKAISLKKRGLFDAALINLQIAITVANSSNLHKEKCFALKEIGDIYFKSKDYKNTLNYYTQSRSAITLDTSSILVANIYLSLGNVFLQTAAFDSALIYFKKSIPLFKKNNYLQGVAYATGNIGMVFSSLNHLPQSNESLKTGIELLMPFSDYYAIICYQITLANNALKQDNYQYAKLLADSCLTTAINENLVPQQRDIYELQKQIYIALGNYKGAYQAQTQYYILRDSLINIDNVRKLADLRTEHEVSIKQAEVDKAFAQSKMRLYAIICLLIGVIALIIMRWMVVRKNKQLSRALELETAQRNEIETQRYYLEESNQTKDRLFAIIGHDLRGPMSTLKLSTTAIRELTKHKIDPNAEILMHGMVTTINQIEVLLNNLLNWSIEKQGMYSFRIEKIGIEELINNVFSMNEAMAHSKNIKMQNISPQKVGEVMIDSNCVSTVIRNLLSNALKFTRNGGEVTIKCSAQNSMLYIEVADTGIGISNDKINQLFDQAVTSEWGTYGEKGTGIGLSLVKELLSLNRGNIRVESELGQGSTFFVELPIRITNNIMGNLTNSSINNRSNSQMV